MIVNQRSHAVLGSRIDDGRAILDARQTILSGTYPDATVRRRSHTGGLLTGQWSVIAEDTLVAGAVPELSVGILCNGCDVTVEQGLELIDITAAIC